MSGAEGSSLPANPPLRLHTPPAHLLPPIIARPAAASCHFPLPPSSPPPSGARSSGRTQQIEIPKNKHIDGTGKVKVKVNEGANEQGYKEEFTAYMLATGPGTSVKRSRKPMTSIHKQFAPETPGLIEGGPGNSMLPANNNCRYDSSLGLLTKKFINLLQKAEDGTLDLNRATDILEVQKRRIYDITNVLEGVGLIEKKLKNMIRWTGIGFSRPRELEDQVALLKAEAESLSREDCRLDEMIREMEENLCTSTADKNIRKWLYLTKEDINDIPCFQNSTLIAIKAPHGTSVEVPGPDEGLDFRQRHYQILLRSSTGPIDCYLISNNEAQQSEAMELDDERCHKNAMCLQQIDSLACCTTEQRQSRAMCESFSDSFIAEECVNGIVKIVPSDIDTAADYWLSSNLGISMTHNWGS